MRAGTIAMENVQKHSKVCKSGVFLNVNGEFGGGLVMNEVNITLAIFFDAYS